jgi:hypothetical protein
MTHLLEEVPFVSFVFSVWLARQHDDDDIT